MAPDSAVTMVAGLLFPDPTLPTDERILGT